MVSASHNALNCAQDAIWGVLIAGEGEEAGRDYGSEGRGMFHNYEGRGRERKWVLGYL